MRRLLLACVLAATALPAYAAPVDIYAGSAIERVDQMLVRLRVTPEVITCEVTAASADQSDVETAIDDAIDGDDVCIPADEATWTTTTTITKAITLRGSGCAYDGDGRPTSCSTVIKDNAPDPGSGRSAIMSWTLVANKDSRMTGIEFQNDAVAPEQAYNGVIIVSGATTDARRMRVDHNFFNDLKGVSVFSTNVLGVYDHNNFYKELHAGIFLYTYHTNWGGFTFSDGSWGEAVDFGSEEWLFIENNLFNRNVATPYAINDAYRGARYVVRYNDIINGWIELHGTDSGGRARGARAVQVYQNAFSCVGATCSYGLNARSGTGLFEDNTFTGFTSPHLTLAAYRLFYPFLPWGEANGLSPLDVNLGGGPFESGTATGGGSMTMVDSGASFPDLTGYSVLRSSGCVWYCASVILSNTATTITYDDGGNYPDLQTSIVQASPAPTTTTATFSSAAFALVGDDIEIPCNSANVVRVTNIVGTAYTWTPAITAPSAGAVACLGDLTFRSGDAYAIYQAVDVFDQPGRGMGTQLLALTISGCTESGATAACTTNEPHGFATTDFVSIADVTPSGYQGTFQITVTGATTFTYTALYSGLANGDNNGTATKIPATNDQVDEPWYECRNTQGATNVDFTTEFDVQIRSGEHYLPDTCWKGTFYTYPHPLTVTP